MKLLQWVSYFLDSPNSPIFGDLTINLSSFSCSHRICQTNFRYNRQFYIYTRICFEFQRQGFKCQSVKYHTVICRIPALKLKIPGKAFLKSESRTSVTFKLQFLTYNIKSVFHSYFLVTDLLSPNRCHWWIAKVKNYNLNITEVPDPDFKNTFPGIFNFTVGILH